MDSIDPVFYIKVFAWISITGICCVIFMDFWIPILLGSALFTYLVFKVADRRPPR